MCPQRIVIAVPLEESLLPQLYEWGSNFDFTHVDEVHLLHVVKKSLTPMEYGLVESPDDFTYNEMVLPLEKFLRVEGQKIVPSDYTGALSYEVTKGFTPEEEVVDILRSFRATLIVVSTRGKHGLDGFFHRSFTDYMIKFSPCDVLVIRPPAEVKKSV